ncbi:short-subunit dehydrogenase [Thermomonospora umbrina]|uniref:Short-subunit dehydrogenase n=1 Tax=Thermomonospora umbrina TaxID=111806 RepID=A0A3D9SR62_9ACTN|nr:short-subunit dehydrogenase [Thermomonospora umbrina]
MDGLDLTAPESRLWDAYPTGAPVDLGDGRPDEPAPDRTVRAEVIARLLLGGREGRPGFVPAVRLSGAYITGRLDLSGGDVECELTLRHCRLTESPDLSNVRTRQIEFAGCRMPGLSGDGIQVDGYLSLIGSRIDGEVRLPRGQITAGLRMNDVVIHQTDPARWGLFARGLNVDAGTHIRDAAVSGGISLVGARMNGGLFLQGTTVGDRDGMALDAWNIVIADAAEFSAGFSAEGMVRLRGAKVECTLSFDQATLRATTDPCALAATSMQVEEMHFRPAVPVVGRVVLDYSHIGVLRDNPDRWPETLWLRGLTYDALRGCPPQDRLNWLGRNEEFHPQPYEQLAAWYRQIGHDDLARKVLLAKLRARRGTLGRGARLWSRVLDWTVGHGYRPWMAAAWVALLAVAGAVIFSIEPARPLRPPGERPDFSAFVYTLDLLIPLGTFGLRDAYDPVGWTRWYAYGLIAAGWILVTALIAGATGCCGPTDRFARAAAMIGDNGGMGTYLITGATGGIGAAAAELLADRGHDLVLVGRSAERLATVTARLGSGAHARTQVMVRDANGTPVAAPAGRRGTTQPVVLDLSEPRRLEAALAVAGLPERLDGVVHSAGVVDLGPVAEQDADHWIDQLMVNLVAAAELTRLLLPALRAARGQVVFVNSGAGLRAGPGWSAYAASKHGLKALADSLRAEEPDIRVTSVYPGRTATEMQRKVRAQEGRPYEAGEFIEPITVARTIVAALETTPDATITDVSVRP